MKLSGVAATIEIACATIVGRLVLSTSSWRIPSATRKVVMLTAKKRAAWNPAW